MKDLRPILDCLGGEPIIIAGPCSAESREQVIATAEQLAGCGVKIFRAGLWKPRTKPGGFEGVGRDGLPWLREVKKRFGMLVATEVATPAHVEEAIAGGVDILWVGARTSANPFAMQALADTFSRLQAVNTPVLVKNPVSPDLDLWIGAIERLYNAGLRRLGAIHRGFSTFGDHIYRNMPQWNIPVELRLRYPSLPIICDPSHMGGCRELIQPLAQEALDLGFDGLIVESHVNPDVALSDAAQQLTPECFRKMVDGLAIRRAHCSSERLELLRRQIDMIDNELLGVLARRMEVARKIGEYKKEHNMPIVQAERAGDVVNSRVSRGAAMGMSEQFLKTVLMAIHDESVRQQKL